MEFRQAVIGDLPQIKCMYKAVISKMNENKIEIWDEIYPCEFFIDDIKQNRLYLMVDGEVTVAAFALSAENAASSSLHWQNDNAKAVYLDRLGVNVNCSRQGVGNRMLTEAKKTARDLGAEYLRLFVVDINEPAIRLYEKNGFARVDGIHDEVVDDDLILHEYGYEIKL